VFDLPPPQPLVVSEHRAHGCLCATCGQETRAAFPAGITAPVQYGERISAFVLYLLYYQLLPEKRLSLLMADRFGVHLVTATIGRISQDCAQRFQGFAEAVRKRVATAPVKHLDETGFRIASKTQWLHIASTLWLTFYRVAAKRGNLLADVAGIIVHDHWKPYYTIDWRAARAVQCAPPARTEGAGRNREGRLGRADAAAVTASLSSDEPRPRPRRAVEARSDRADPAALRHHRGPGPGVP
jgi:transposase